MLPCDCLTGWWALTRWIQDARTEQDLGINRALLKMFSHPALAGDPCFVAAGNQLTSSPGSSKPRACMKFATRNMPLVNSFVYRATSHSGSALESRRSQGTPTGVTRVRHGCGARMAVSDFGQVIGA